MHRRGAGERILADAEARRQINLALERLAHGHVVKRALELMDLNARNADAVKLPLEAIRVLRRPRGDKRTAHAAAVLAARRFAGVYAQLG